MKNKKVTYALGAAVLAIWGIIIYRVINYYAGQSNDNPAQPAVSALHESYNDYSELKDTTHLQLNYPNPFAQKKEIRKDTASIVTKPVLKARAITPSVGNSNPANWNFIRYSGYIRNSGTHKLIAILTLNGREITLQEGESLDHVKLLKNLRDSIRISYSGQTRFITLDHNP